MDRKVGQSEQENKSGESRARPPLYREPRRTWIIELRDVRVADGRQFLSSARQRETGRELILTLSPTATEALDRIRDAIDDVDTVDRWHAEMDPDRTRPGGRHYLTGGRR